jgi:putative signal transducing protein
LEAFRKSEFSSEPAMTDNMVKLATFGNLEEAFMIRNRLDEEGVKALAVEETNGGLWQLNALLGGAAVYVPAEQVEHAREVLEHHEDSGAPESTSITENPSVVAVQPVETSITEEVPDPEPTEADFAAADAEDASPLTEASPGEAMATRAFRSAVLGLLIATLNFISAALIFWMLFTGYSFYLLFQLARWEGELGKGAYARMLLALIFNGISVLTFIVLMRW